MADEAAEAEGTGSTNGASSAHVDARAAFLAMDGGETATEKPAKPAAREAADDDSDLDDEDDVDSTDESSSDADEDPDKDLNDDDDENEDEDEDKEAGKKPDADRDKRLGQVRRTDKRLREQREKDWAARDAEFEQRVQAVEKQWAPRIEKAERIERLMARAAVDPFALLQAADVPESAYEYLGQTLYTHSKAKDDPKAKAAVSQLMRDRERDDEIAQLKKWREDREKTEKEREQQTVADRELESFFDKVTKAASDKTPLAASFVKAAPAEARERLQLIAFRLAKESGKLPDARRVMIELEKDRRKALRDMGIDPKARGAAAASNAATDSKPTTTPKKTDKKIEKPMEKSDGKKKLSPKEEFMRLNGKYD